MAQLQPRGEKEKIARHLETLLNEMPPPDFLETPMGRVVWPIHPQKTINMQFIKENLSMTILASSIPLDQKWCILRN